MIALNGEKFQHPTVRQTNKASKQAQAAMMMFPQLMERCPHLEKGGAALLTQFILMINGFSDDPNIVGTHIPICADTTLPDK